MKKCTFCGGTGKLDKDYFDFAFKKNPSSKRLSKKDLMTDLPKQSDQPMSDEETQKLIDEYTNPALKEAGLEPIEPSVMSQYPSRPPIRERRDVEVSVEVSDDWQPGKNMSSSINTSPLDIVSVIEEKLNNGSSDKAIEFFRQVKLHDKEKYDFTNEESEFNTLGYSLLSKKRPEDAIRHF